MSLQLWMPLNGAVYNQGLSQINITSDTSTSNDNGKIGKCLHFSENEYITLSNGLRPIEDKEFSICYWVKEEINPSTNVLRIVYRYGSFMIGQYYSKCNLWDNGIIDIASQSYDTTQWTHCCVTIDKNKIAKMYINGIYHTSYTITNNFSTDSTSFIYIGHRGVGGNDSYNDFYVNDLRIYDHCLSQKEVEELAKGLVLHYKMDNNDSGIIYDCSGYHNDATIIGTSTLVASPKYSYGLYMNNTSTANRIESNNALNLSTTGPITVSFWAKFDTSVGQVLFAIPSTLECASNTTSYIWVNPTASQAGFSLTGFNNNDWNHIVIMRDGSNFYVYINGESVSRNGSNNNWTHNGTKMYLFNRNANNNYAANASISDFRIYATILTEAQIKELYNTSVTIDKDGNVYTREAIEQTDKLSINKQGQFIVNQVKDSNVTTASILKSTKTISSNNFYEY